MSGRRLFQLLLFSVPLLFASPLYNNFEPLKAYALQVGVVLWLTLHLIAQVKKNRLPFPSSSLFLLFFLFLVVQTGAAFAGQAWRVSASAFSFQLLYFLLVYIVYAERIALDDIRFPLVFASFFVSLYALMQKMGLDWIHWVGLDTTIRPVSTLGNPDYLSGFLALTLPFHIQGFLREKGKWRSFYFLTTTLSFLAMLLTYARGGWLCFIVLFLLLGWHYKKKKKAWLFLLLYFPLLLTLSSRIQVRIDQRTTNTWKRVVGMRDLSYPSFRIRFFLWRDTLKMIRQKPWFGYGSGNFSFSFSRYRSRDLARMVGAERVPEHPHNEYLLTTVETGFLGLFFFLWINAFALLLLWKKNRFLAFLLIGILLEDFYYYPVTPIYLLYYTLLGSTPLCPNSTFSFSFRPRFKKTVALLLGLTFLAFTGTRVSLISADLIFKKGMRKKEAQQVVDSLSAFEKAFALSPGNFVYGLTLAQEMLQAANLVRTKSFQKKLLSQSDRVLKQMEKIFGKEPHILQVEAQLYNQWKPRSHARKKRVHKLLLESIALDSNNSIWRKNIALFYLQQKEFERALFHLQKAVEIDPSFGEAFSLMGIIQFKQGRKKKAISLQRRAIRASPDYYPAYPRAILLYLDLDKKQEALQLLAIARGKFPQKKELLALEKVVLQKVSE